MADQIDDTENTDDIDDVPATAIGQTPFVTLLRWLDTLTGSPDPDATEAIESLLPEGSEFWPYVRQFSALIVLSASIAAFGLLSDSSAVVIGAMLVAPLMTPIAAAGASLVMARNVRLLKSAVIILFGTLGAIAVGYVTAAISATEVTGPAELPGEVISRTFPGLLDLGVAITAGAAAGFILPRRSALSALPGVGIAVALVPPLATVGITAQLGFGEQARNALLLYLTNLAAIVFSVALMLLLAGFRPHQRASRRGLLGRVAITMAAVLVVAIPLTLHTQQTVREATLRRSITQAVQEWDDSVRIVELIATLDGSLADVDLLVSGPNEAKSSWQLAEAIERRFDGPVDLRLLYQRDALFVVSVR